DTAWNPTLPSLPPPRLAAEDASGNVALVHAAVQSYMDPESLVFVPADTLQGVVAGSALAYMPHKLLRFEGSTLYAVLLGSGTGTAMLRYLGGKSLDAFQILIGQIGHPCVGFSDSGKIYDFAVHDGFVYIGWNRGLFRVAVADAKYDATWQPIPYGTP